MTKTPAQLQEQSDRDARKIQRALARDERELKKAARSGKRRRAADILARTKDNFTRNKISQAIFSEIPKAPKQDWTEYRQGRQAAFDSGEESSYCNFGKGAKSITRHSGQRRKKDKDKSKAKATEGGVTIVEYSDKHNDRYDTDEALHIDQEREKYNVYWNMFDGYYKPSPFDRKKRVRVDNEEESIQPMWFWEAEDRFVRETFGAYINAQNEIYFKNRQYDYITDIDDHESLKNWKKGWRKPFEMLLELGSREDSATPEQLIGTTVELINEIKEKYNFVTINFALHCDERGAPHVHLRGYFVAVDENNNLKPGKDLALQQRGVTESLGKRFKKDLEDQNLDPTKYIEKKKEKGGRFYNRGTTFSAEMSELLFDIAERHGVKVIREAQVLRGGKDQKKYLATLKGAPRRVAASLQRLEERRGNHFDVLNVIDTVRQGLQRFPTTWLDPSRAAAVAEETHKKLKVASNALDALPGLLEQAGIEGVDVEIKQLRETISRTHAAAGRAKRNAGSAKVRAKDDSGNEIKLKERFYWLEQLDRLNAALARAGDARPDDELAEELEEAKAERDAMRAERDAALAELDAMRQQHQQQEQEEHMTGSMNERLQSIEYGIALSRVADAQRALERGLLVWDGGVVDRELLQRAQLAECVRDGALNAELANQIRVDEVSMRESWRTVGEDVVSAARNAPAPAQEPAQQESMSTKHWFASLTSSQHSQQRDGSHAPSYRSPRPRPPL